jgi:enediyne biosynthesis protein E3
MASGWRALRRRILTPSMKEAKLSVRGFHVKDSAAQTMLETIGETFLTGYAYAAEARQPAEAEERLEELPWQFRGFAYEGAGMGFAIRDGLPFGGRYVSRFLEGRARDHVYMVYVGIGWAMARLPRFRWAKASASASDPLLRWLVLDGYGFHQAYFYTDRYVRQQYQEPHFPWPAGGPARYASRVIDQGIGRAIWFVGGADPDVATELIDAFDESRRADLYSGAGLAATYAGAADETELRVFLRRARNHLPEVAQGSVFAGAARFRAGLVTPQTTLAARLLCGVTPEQASDLADATRAEPFGTSDVPSYELWRQRIASGLAVLRTAP